jgi:hypothetical protein
MRLSATLCAALCLALLVSCGDPLADMKKTSSVAIPDQPAAEKVVEDALAALAANDPKALFRCFSIKDYMEFEILYSESLFKNGDFAPAKMTSIEGVDVQGRTVVRATVRSERRKRDYLFSLSRKNGKYGITTIAEKGK